MAKPFKIWNVDRSLRKSVVANSLQQMVNLGKSKLDISPTVPVKVVLECDGTEVDDEEYFAFLQPNTVFQFLQASEKWQSSQSASQIQRNYDEVDCAGDSEKITRRLSHLLQKMQTDITSIILLSSDDMKAIIDMPLSELASHLSESEFYADQIQVACRNRLEKIYQTQDTFELLRIYDASRRNSLLVEDSSKKRKTET